MRHPTLALIALAFTAGSLLHCELGIPAWADDPKVISYGCSPTGPENDPSLIADIHDSRIRPESVVSVHLCDIVCTGSAGEDRDCPCLLRSHCDPEGMKAPCVPTTDYQFDAGRLIASCATRLGSAASSRVVVHLR